MRFRAERNGDVSVLRLLQDLDFNASRGFRHMLEEEIAQGARGVILDMTAIAYVASITIGILVDVHNRLRGDGGRGLVLLNPQTRVKDILRLVHLGRVIPILDDEPAALQAAAGTG